MINPKAPWFFAALDHLAKDDAIGWVDPSEERVFIAYVTPCSAAPDTSELQFVAIKALHRENPLSNDRDRFFVWQGFAQRDGRVDAFYAQRWKDVKPLLPPV